MIITAEDHDQTRAIIQARDLYLPPNLHLSNTEYTELVLRFKVAVKKLKENPEVKDLFGDLVSYVKETKQLTISDKKLKSLDVTYIDVVTQTIAEVLKFNVIFIYSFVGIICYLPFFFLIKNKVERERQAVTQ